MSRLGRQVSHCCKHEGVREACHYVFKAGMLPQAALLVAQLRDIPLCDARVLLQATCLNEQHNPQPQDPPMRKRLVYQEPAILP